METKVPTVHPAFEPNQILTSTHLNQLREYLDDENRLTRVRLSGFGIVCGLEITFDTSTRQLTVKKGYGISTEGYLLELAKDTTFTKFRTYKDPFTPKYEFGITGNTKIATIEELLPASAPTGDPVSELDPTDKVAVLFYEFNDVELKSCTGSNCDNKGKKREMQPRVLLLHKDAVRTNNNEDLLSIAGELDLLKIPRLSSVLPATMFRDITSYSVLSDHYTKIIKDQQKELDKAITNAYDKYAAILGLSSKDKTTALTALANVHGSTKAVQYIYDHLKDVTEAYNEFAYTAQEFRKSCFPTLNEFPRHLLLGKLSVTNTTYYDEYRSYFLDAPLLPQQDREMVKAQMLFHKMLMLLMKFNISASATKLKITPSKHYPLPVSDHSIPYYYTVETDKMLKFWNLERALRKKQAENLSYYADIYASGNKYVNDPLSYSIDEYPLLRIEGFIGQKLDIVKTKLEEEKKKYNLSFDILALKIDNTNGITTDYNCGFSDLQLHYLSARSELITFMRSMIEKITVTVNHYSSLYPSLLMPSFTALTDSIKRLNNTLLPYEVKDFNYASFIGKYKDVVKEAILLKVNITNLISGRLENDLYIESNTTCIADVNSLSGLSSMLDPLVDSAGWVQLAVIEATRKWRENSQVSQKRFFEYADKHPGLEHIAGVKPGGTFILVYSEDKVLNSTTDNQVVADFALSYSCCSNDCQPVSTQLTLPSVAMPHYLERMVASAPITEFFEILTNDFKLNDLSAVTATDVTITIVPSTSSPSYVTFTEDNSTGVKRIKYVNSNPSLPGVHTCTYELKKGGVLLDSATVLVNVRKQIIAKPLARFDVATTVENKKVSIYALKNDMPTGAQLVLVANDRATLVSGTLTTALGNTVIIKGSSSDQYFEFDPSGSGNIKDTVTDFFTYKLKTTGATDSEEVKVTVYILPCCGSRIIFKLPKYEFCRNDSVQKFTIEGLEDAEIKASEVIITGPGVTNEGDQWYFDPSSRDITATTNISFKLLYQGMVLGIIEAKVTPLASYNCYKVVFSTATYIYFNSTSIGASFYKWEFPKNTYAWSTAVLQLTPEMLKNRFLPLKFTAFKADRCFDVINDNIDLTTVPNIPPTKIGSQIFTSSTGTATAVSNTLTNANVTGYQKTLEEIISFNANLSNTTDPSSITTADAVVSADLTRKIYNTINTATAPKATQQEMSSLLLEQSLVTVSMLTQTASTIDTTTMEKKLQVMASNITDLSRKQLITSSQLTQYKIVVDSLAQTTDNTDLKTMLTKYTKKLGG